MTPEEFENKLQELFKSAPEGTVMFMTYSNDKEKRPNIFSMQGNPVDLIADLALFGKKEQHANKILTVAVMGMQAIRLAQ